MEENERWSFHLEYLKVAIALSTAVIAAAAAIYVDDSKIPTDSTGYFLVVGVALFVVMLIFSAASLGLLSSRIALFNPPPAAPPSARLTWWAITCANISFVVLILGSISLALFFGMRTWNAGGPAFQRAIALGQRSLQLDPAKGQTASVKSIDLQGDTYVITFVLSPGSGTATVVTDDAGTKLKSMKKP
jgi:hypothetical protein